jgi:hypothetical protein
MEITLRLFLTPKKEIKKLFENQILINQSTVPLINEAIEILCLGLNFIPSQIILTTP